MPIGYVPNKNNGKMVYVFNGERQLLKACINHREVERFTGIEHKKVAYHVKKEKPIQGFILSWYLEPKLKIDIL